MPEIQRVSIKHEAIMDYLMANPCVKLGDVARHFGITQPWLSQIIHSDAFQTLLREKQGVAFHHSVLPLREKMTAIAHQALERIADTLPLETETKNLVEVAESVLDRLGFGTKPAPGVQINNQYNTHVTTLRTDVEEARKLLGKAERPNLGVVIDADRVPVPLPQANASSVVENDPISAFLRGSPEGAETATGAQIRGKN